MDRQILFAIIPEVHNVISASAARALLNPVKHILVEQVEHWQGFSSDSQCARGMDEVYPRPDRTAYHTYRRHPDAKQLAVFLMIRLDFSRLPHGNTIEYSYDLPGRRIAKRVNGKQTEALL